MYEEQRDDQNVLIGIRTTDGRICFDPNGNNNIAGKYREWVAQGNTPSPDPKVLANVKAAKRQEFIAEAVARITIQVPEWNTYERVAFIASFWNMLNGGSADASQNKAKDIYVFVKGTAIPDVNSKTTVADALAMDAPTYPGWPI